MSRIGKKPIPVPSGVTVTVTDNFIFVKGPKGELSMKIHPDIKAEFKDGFLMVSPLRVTKRSSALWGLFRSLLANTVEGVIKGFEKKLEFEGIGYKANVEGDSLVMQLGFSHPVRFKVPEGIKFFVEKNIIVISGVNKELVGNVAASIRKFKPLEPYKGKGIRYQGEIIRRKSGKKTVASA